MSEEDALVANYVLEILIKYNRPITFADIRNEFAKFPDEYLVIMEIFFLSFAPIYIVLRKMNDIFQN